MNVYRWEEIEKEQMNPRVARQVIHGERMTVARIHLAKGAIVPEHKHPNEQITLLQSGRLRFAIAGEERVVEAGETVQIPPDLPHAVEALEDSVAVDLFSPVREDWIRGDDAYLRR
ncbi:MAG: cupin domain-containing protein [Bryobacterales bacterium]|nr:cupin domain-containing protein [Bryobacteraceae bacterium]MDW8355365.1 cupin domain-containing protein [Bryobacterales bacterium]